VGFTPGVLLFCWGKQDAPKERKMTLQPPLEGLVDYRLSGRTHIVLALAELRREWQLTAKGGSLLKVETPVGLLLSDIADRLELTAQERHVVLGGKLINEVDGFREQRISRRLPS
jgi:hypothetical protein